MRVPKMMTDQRVVSSEPLPAAWRMRLATFIMFMVVVAIVQQGFVLSRSLYAEKLAKEAEELSKRRVSLLFLSDPRPTIVANTQGRLVFWNVAARQCCYEKLASGQTVEDLFGESSKLYSAYQELVARKDELKIGEVLQAKPFTVSPMGQNRFIAFVRIIKYSDTNADIVFLFDRVSHDVPDEKVEQPILRYPLSTFGAHMQQSSEQAIRRRK